MSPRLELADILRCHGPTYRHQHADAINRGQYRVMRAIEQCRTAALGGHLEQCDACGHQRIAYNSCRNRHCPKCQSLARARWLDDRHADLLPVPYFHVVFTLPESVAAMAFQNKRVAYEILFQATAETLQTIAADPRHLGAAIGFIAILHTWGQNLVHHPHLHCVVPGGGLSPDGQRWVACRPGFFLPVRVLSRLFRRLFLARLQQAFEAGALQFCASLAPLAEPDAFACALADARRTDWVVYAKAPFGGPQQVLDYLGRYTHRVAIANHRLLACDDTHVTFRWKDYRRPDKPRVMRLPVQEFIRRFLQHVLPHGLQRIRHYGLLSNRLREARLATCRRLLDVESSARDTCSPPADYRDHYEALTGRSLRVCPACSQGRMFDFARWLPSTSPRAPPAEAAA
ncbi:IS91 family transposase [Burkholderia cepacia]|uniref:IS91 family transposase n=1 Tax=Burkholderia cepacia TaxID=292 RepID=UPI001F3A9F03